MKTLLVTGGPPPMSGDAIKDTVRDKYGQAALKVLTGNRDGCCGDGRGGGEGGDCGLVSSNLYDAAETAALPPQAVLASLGCGNPTALADLHAGEVVLDLGSGGGIDVLLSARRVGPSGKAYGLDMTEEMLTLARENQRAAGITNVEFLQGDIERIPLPDATVDVIISNCVINLSADKRKVLAEAFRVLKPGGRFAVSDVVVRGEIPAAVRRSMELWVGCVAGALEEKEFEALLAQEGFAGISIEPTRIYQFDDARELLAGAGRGEAGEGGGLDTEVLARDVGGRVMGAFVRAHRPVA